MFVEFGSDQLNIVQPRFNGGFTAADATAKPWQNYFPINLTRHHDKLLFFFKD